MMEIKCKIESRVRLRMVDGLLLLVAFVNLLLMIILSYDMWKPMLFYRDKRIFLSICLILLVVRVLLYLLDTAMWRIFGVEYVEVNSQGIVYIKKKRLIKQKIHIEIRDIISINKNVVKRKFIISNTEDDKGRVQIAFIRNYFCFSIKDQIGIGSQFTDNEIDKLLSAYSSIKTSVSGSHSQ